MDFLDALKVLWRRWLIVLLGILITGLGCGAVIAKVQTVYQGSAQYLLLLPSKANGDSNPQNPLINQPAGLVIGASLIAAEINTKDTEREMARDGFESDFALALAPSGGPLLSITVTDTDRVGVIATRDEILRRLDKQLAELQERDIPDIPDNQIISALPVAVNQEAEAVPGAKIKALVVVVALGGIITLLLVFALDRPLSRRAARRAEKKKAKSEAAGAGGAPPDDTATKPAAKPARGGSPEPTTASTGSSGNRPQSRPKTTGKESDRQQGRGPIDKNGAGNSARPAVRRGR
ncbi:hypothetical protein [Nocardioides sp. InS609-2]|uniref:hypothetical protein n=1 Tax=Nocardioides sp. InS609-2 TaxID=2760705 RepID=UPI0020BD53BD|nr:hypothetical protein [Nocardioides sp. InS609-2]